VEKLIDLGDGLSVCRVLVTEVKEQDLNARMMEHGMFAQLVSNVRKRGQLESLPYCAIPRGGEEIEIVSGHHRFQAAAAAGLGDVVILLDESGLNRSQITAKQIAHNALAGFDDPAVLAQLLATVTDVDDLLETFIGADQPTQLQQEPIVFPEIEFEYKSLSFAFLPHQMDNFTHLMDQLQGRQDFVAAASLDQYEDFANAISKYARVKQIGRASTVVAYLVDVALRELATIAQLEALAADGDGDDPAS
jgi:hypothetical protein